MPEQPLTSDVERTAAAAAQATLPQTRAILGGILLVLMVAAGLWMLYMLQGVILLVVLAMFFAYLVAPLVDLVHLSVAQRGRQRPIPRAVSSALSISCSSGQLVQYVLILDWVPKLRCLGSKPLRT